MFTQFMKLSRGHFGASVLFSYKGLLAVNALKDFLSLMALPDQAALGYWPPKQKEHIVHVSNCHLFLHSNKTPHHGTQFQT